MFESIQGKFIFAYKTTIFAPLIYFIEQFIWQDWNLLVTILLLLFMDGFALFIRAMISKDYQITDAMKNFGTKTLSISLVIFGIGVFDSATINNEPLEFLALINYGFYTSLLAFLFISLLTNIYKIYPLEFIGKMIDKLTKIYE
jgi:hypothetical protein